jgi:hypothetical protein
MRVLFLFLDGVGLGADDPLVNPFAQVNLPHLEGLLGGRKLVLPSAPFHGPRATLQALDACLGVAGLPQSATGQAVLLTGVNVPQEIGYHYGPKPNPEVAVYLRGGGLFGAVSRAGKRAGLVVAYPPRYFHGIHSGKRLYSAIPLAATKAGLPLLTADDLRAGRALAADFTAEAWRDRLGLLDVPVHTPPRAGAQLARLARELDFAFFEYWLSDYAGHGQDVNDARQLLETLDSVLGGLLGAWRDKDGLVLVTSDHGNLEDLSTRRHTANPVPLLLVGPQQAREVFAPVTDLGGVASKVSQVLAL